MLQSISVVIAFHAALDEWNFETVVRQMYPKLQVSFVRINYNTRGAVETALIAVQNLPAGEQIVMSNTQSIHRIKNVLRFNVNL
jgi:limonene-1,2-epoxide hydrolase